MAFYNLGNRITKPILAQSFLIGMIVGITTGIFFTLIFNGFTIETPFIRINSNNYEVNAEVGEHLEEGHHHGMVNETLAMELYDEVKVLCWILTGPKNHDLKAKHVKATWGKRCNYLLFMSTVEDPSLPSIALPVIEDRVNLWGKTKEAFKYIYKNYLDKADWFFKADDDTYAIMENMRYMLRYQNKTKPIYFGYRFKPFVKQGYMSGGAGYVLSKEALRRFVNESLPNKDKCKQENTGDEDKELGICLESVGVEAGDSRDEEGRSRFLPIFPTSLLIPGDLPKSFWLWSYHYYPLQEGMECCSDNIISMHYVDPRTMYLLEYLIYHVKPFGVAYSPTFDVNIKNSTNGSVIYASAKDQEVKGIKSEDDVADEDSLSWNNLS